MWMGDKAGEREGEGGLDERGKPNSEKRSDRSTSEVEQCSEGRPECQFIF